MLHLVHQKYQVLLVKVIIIHNIINIIDMNNIVQKEEHNID